MNSDVLRRSSTELNENPLIVLAVRELMTTAGAVSCIALELQMVSKYATFCNE